jgi:UDP-3-O-acyl N-acetylglucosamine deacetylase
MSLAVLSSESATLSHRLRRQNTISRSAEVTGFGYWSGRDVRLEFHPAEANTGVVFVRTDLASPNRIPATVHQRVEVPRRTVLADGVVRVEMVEHVLAALAGLRIDNCEVHVSGAELPGCDGSSQPFVEALLEAGLQEQAALRPRVVATDITRVGNDEAWVEFRPYREDRLSLTYKLDYGPNNAIGKQTLQVTISPSTFREQLASARTFLWEEEAQWLHKQGLGLRVTPKDVLVFNLEGPIDNTLRFEDECVRHKTLDLVGDLALAGCDIVGQVIAYRSGHRLNAEMVKRMLVEGRMDRT